MNKNERDQRMKMQLNRRMGRSNNGATDLFHNIKRGVPSRLMPGNVGDINRVIWPFWFTFSALELVPNQSGTSSFSVTQEASFIWMAFSKVVYKKTSGPTAYTAIDPDQQDPASGEANGLSFQFRDAQSSRVFSNGLIPLDGYANPNFPAVLQTPVMFLPNSTVECLFTNSDAAATYVPFITMFGYRVRLQDAEQILSLIES